MEKVKIRSLRQAPLRKGTRVLVRADFDVSVRKGRIISDYRIKKILPTLAAILKKGGLVRLVSHLGRPGGRKKAELSMRPVAKHLARLLKQKIIFISDPFDRKLLKKYYDSPRIVFFENIRFWPGEEKNDRRLARGLARWGDIYVNESFASSHRSHASMVSLPQILPSFAGLQLQTELRYLGVFLRRSPRPFVAVLGGIKLETKLPLVRKFLTYADRILIGGAIANSIFRAKGLNTGKSLVEPFVDLEMLKSRKIFLPFDVAVSLAVETRGPRRITPLGGVRENEYIIDIGPESISKFISLLKGAKAIVWNGPLGHTPYFSGGTLRFARALAKIKEFTVIGGGDTVAALERAGIAEKKFSHVSTGGGAMLEFLAGKKLPGIEVLKK